MATKRKDTEDLAGIKAELALLIDPSGMYATDARSTAESTETWVTRSNQQAKARKQSRTEKLYNELKDQSTVHIVALPGADLKAVKGAVKVLEKCAKAAGLNVLFKQESSVEFDITKMPLIDAVAVVGGSNRETAEYILKNIDKGYMSGRYQSKLIAFGGENSKDYAEISDAGNGNGITAGWGYVIATSTGISADRLGMNTTSDALALTIIHGMGHLSGIIHFDNDADDGIGFMASGEGGSLYIYMKGNQSNLSTAAINTFASSYTMKKHFWKRWNNKEISP